MAGVISLPQASSLAMSEVAPTGLLPLKSYGTNFFVSSRTWNSGVSLGNRSSQVHCRIWRSDLKWLGTGIVTRRGNGFRGRSSCSLKNGARIVNCASGGEIEGKEDKIEDGGGGGGGNTLNFSGLVLAITALGYAIPAFTATANAAATKKRAKTPKAPKAVPTMTIEERKEWTKNLPVVREQIPYSELLSLKEEGKLKHIIKHPMTKLKEIPDKVLVVLSDDRVVRTVLPASERDARFWNIWDELRIEDNVIDAYSPPVPGPVVQDWAMKGPSLRVLSGVAAWIRKLGTEKKRTRAPPAVKKNAAQARLEKLDRERKAILEAKREKDRAAKEDARLRKKYANAQFANMQEAERRERIAAAEEAERERKLAQQTQSREEWSNFWYTASRNEGFRFLMGIFFFWLFYLTVVVGVKKRKQDYEDRLKIEQAEDEERKKMREWEQEMETIEAVSTTNDWGKENMSEEERRRLEEVENNPQLKLGLRFMRSGATARRAKGRKPPQYLDLDADIKFADVAGLGDIRKELEEIVDFFTYGEKYRRRGSRIPAGILLCGEPGTGKTLLAKAVAGEAGVNFFSISASQFVEIYVGVGASRVRALYQEARDNAPAVVFIDELDAVGRQRGLIGGSGGQERDSTLNQLLTCLDGFEGRGEVITIAATNRPDILDSALVRPGRFDRKIFIPKPGTKGRAEILKVHARNKPMAEEVDYNAVAEMTDGMVGAQLANILDVAALSVLRDGRTEITTDDLLEAAQLEEGGHPDPRPRSKELLEMLALNEASMAACAVNFPDFKQIQLLTIVPRMGEEKGAVRFRPDQTKFELQSMGRQGMLDYITVQLSPRAADELWNGADNMSTIWADTVDQARSTARDFVYAGLSDRQDLYGLFDCWNEIDQVWAVDVEALKIVNSCYQRALEILDRNRELVKVLVDRLVEERTIRQAEFQDLVKKHGNLIEEIPQPIEVRNEKLAAFREEMYVAKRSSRS